MTYVRIYIIYRTKTQQQNTNKILEHDLLFGVEVFVFFVQSFSAVAESN